MRRPAGFTLIELMIVVAIVAILASVAYPSYQQYVLRANRAAAQQFMLEIGSRQEQYLLDVRQYAVGATALTSLGLAVPGDVAPYYAITVAADSTLTQPNYTITATPVAGSMQASANVLRLRSSGVKEPAADW